MNLCPRRLEMMECALLSCSEQAIWKELALRGEDDLSILGCIEADIFLVKGDSNAIDKLGSLFSVRIINRNVEFLFQHLSINPKAIISHASPSYLLILMKSWGSTTGFISPTRRTYHTSHFVLTLLFKLWNRRVM